MKYYTDITIISKENVHQVWSKLYTQLHIVFVKMKNENNRSNIGVSFTEYSDRFIGTKLRLFSSTKDELVTLKKDELFEMLEDEVHFSSVKEVPTYEHSVIWVRHHNDKSITSLAKRKAKRHNMSYNEALNSLKDYSQQKNNTHFIKMKSLSTNDNFSLNIDFIVSDESNCADFNTYGLSQKDSYVALPWF